METALLIVGLALAVAVALGLAFRRPAGVSSEEVGRLLAAEDAKFNELLSAAKETHAANVRALRQEFAALAAEMLTGKVEQLSRENAKNVKPLFDQLKITFDELKTASESAREANVKLGESLRGKLDEVGFKAQSLGRQADEFVAALRGGNKVQGNWGEGILAKVLEDAGLRRGENFVEQTGAQGAGLPDVTVFDGAHRRILIDAKVNITSFIEAVNADKEGRREDAARAMKEHAKSVRQQVRNLADRQYPVRLKEKDADPAADYSDIVIMMMPSEATYAAAVTADPALIAYANAQKVVLAAPQMLFGYLVLFKMGLDRLQVDRHNQEIGRCAERIVERMDAALAELEAAGKALGDAQNRYATALGRLGNGTNNQNVLTPAKEILRLVGAKKPLKSAALRDGTA
ncbi:MAG: DNA recombination protein RmuC [Kiritimatiellia bacterium]